MLRRLYSWLEESHNYDKYCPEHQRTPLQAWVVKAVFGGPYRGYKAYLVRQTKVMIVLGCVTIPVVIAIHELFVWS